MPEESVTIAVLGGTGKEGSGLALRFLNAGFRVLIGSRDPAKAQASAAAMNERLICDRASGASLTDAAAAGDIVFLTVPYAAQLATLELVRQQLQGKIVVDVTVPLVPPRVARVQLPAGGSAVLAGQELLGEGVHVVSAFQNVSHERLETLGQPVGCDVLVCGDDKDARERVVALASAIGIKAFHAGALANSAAAEALTSVMIFINKHYKAEGAGIALIGMPVSGPV